MSNLYDVVIRIRLPSEVALPAGGVEAAREWWAANGPEATESAARSVTGVDELQAEGITLPAFKVSL